MGLLDLMQNDQSEGGRVDGVALGLVTDNHDPEGLGRVKVSYPWREDGQQSFWARIAVLSASSGYGTFFLPEVGDEVLLAFDKGDVQFPYVLGCLWNGKDKPPANNSDGENNTRCIRSRSGNQITLFDKDGQESVKVETKGGQTVELKDGSSPQIVIKDSTGSNVITIDSSQNSISIQSGASLRLSSPSVDIQSSGTMTIKAGGTLTIQGSLVQIN